MAEKDIMAAVAKLVEGMRKAGTPPTGQEWNRLGAQMSNAFNAKKEELAILRLSADGQVLNFLFPLRLSVVGAIPITTVHSLAAKTIREKRGDIVNNFASYKHPTIFEAVNLSEEERAAPIQKIMSSPMIVDGKLVGVIQISRKAHSGEPVGPDFTPADLARLGSMGAILGKFLAEIPTPAFSPPSHPAKG